MITTNRLVDQRNKKIHEKMQVLITYYMSPFLYTDMLHTFLVPDYANIMILCHNIIRIKSNAMCCNLWNSQEPVYMREIKILSQTPSLAFTEGVLQGAIKAIFVPLVADTYNISSLDFL